MAGFTKVTGADIASKKRTIGAVVYAVGDLLMADRAAGTLVLATNDATVSLVQGGGIVTKATDGVVTEVEVQPIDFDAVYKVESVNSSNSAHRYQRMEVTSAGNIVNNSASDDSTNGIVQQVGEIGINTNKVILVEFLRALS